MYLQLWTYSCPTLYFGNFFFQNKLVDFFFFPLDEIVNSLVSPVVLPMFLAVLSLSPQ